MNWPDDFINKVICGNCLEIMKEIPDECVDMILTSPPYGKIRDYHGFEFDYKKIGLELFRIIKSGGIMVWVVGDEVINGEESGESFRQALYFKSIGFKLHDTMIYKKNGIVFPESVRYYQCFEYMFILSKGKLKTINLIKDRKNISPPTKKYITIRQKDGSMKKEKLAEWQEIGFRNNIWTYDIGYLKSTKDLYAYNHPAIFPEKLVEDHILSWSNENDIILDPMAGSGTTLKVAKNTKRKFIGIEISKKYCELCKLRISQGVL